MYDKHFYILMPRETFNAQVASVILLLILLIIYHLLCLAASRLLERVVGISFLRDFTEEVNAEQA